MSLNLPGAVGFIKQLLKMLIITLSIFYLGERKVL